MGMPRYLPNPEVEANPRISHRDSLVSLSTFKEKQTLDFASLIVWPEQTHQENP